MHIKRFEAATMLEAVQQVKDELGPDALVLSTRTVKKSGGAFGLLGRSVVEVTAAVDRDARRGRSQPSAQRVAADRSWNGLQITKALVDPLEAEIRELRRSVERLSVARGEHADLVDCVADMQRMTADLAGRWRTGSPDPACLTLSGRLLEAGFSPRHAFDLGEEAARKASRQPGEARSGEKELREALAQRLDSHLLPPRDDDRPQVTFFIGPTGVGKTTTLAKLAARDQYETGQLSLITTDTYRIGAEEQLRTFANLLDVPFGVASGVSDLCELVAKKSGFSGHHFLIDTAGRGHADDEPIAELLRLRERFGKRARFHLVLSATTKDADLNAELKRYEVLAPDSLIVTKLDESENLGNIANVLLDDAAPPLAWLGTGQRVPEDLAIPDPQLLAQRMIGRMP